MHQSHQSEPIEVSSEP